MADVKVPELGESISTAEVLKILVSEGDEIEEDQPVLELESDKASLEMPSPAAGTVSAIKVSEGDEVEVGQVVMTLSNGAADAQAEQEEPEDEQPEDAKEGDDEEPAEKQKAEAEAEDEAEDAAEDEEEDADRDEAQDEEVEAKAAEQVEHVEGKKAERVDEVDASDEDEAEGEGEQGEAQTTASAGPATRKLARELGVALADVEPSGPGDRVTKEDVKRYVRSMRGTGSKRGTPIEDLSKWGDVERAGMTRRERVAADRLTRAWREIPHVTHHDEVDISALEHSRRQLVEREPDLPLTITALAMKAVVPALLDYPRFNSAVDAGAHEIVYRHYIHIGVAVDTDRGLLVPVVRDADRKTTRQLADEIALLADRARDGDLKVEEMQGGTFTITNVGGIGGTAFTPIIHPPQVAILGIARAREVDGRLLLPLSLSYDHRAVNGADAARFTRDVGERLSEPLALLLDC